MSQLNTIQINPNQPQSQQQPNITTITQNNNKNNNINNNNNYKMIGNKYKFSNPPDQSAVQMQDIMSTIHKKQQQILNILNRYKQTVPNDQYQYAYQLQQLYSKQNKHQQQQAQNNMNQYKNKVKNKGKSYSQYKTPQNSSNNNINYNSSKRKNNNNINDNNYSLNYYNPSNTIDLDNYPKTTNNKSDSRHLSYQQRSMDKIKNTFKDRNNIQFKLPILANNIKQVKKKQQYQLRYQKIDKDYNQNVIKFYQQLTNRKPNPPLKNKQKFTLQIKNKNNKSINKRRSQLTNLPQDKYPIGIKNKNIFQATQTPQQYDILLKKQIMQPIAYHPYSQMSTYQKNMPQSKQKTSRAISLSMSHAQNNDSDDQKPTEVPMSYYIRTFNQKLKQQSKQQINYLYFSKGDQNESNKQWADQIIKMFQRHDAELTKVHQSMKYLQHFDQGFFTAGIYQTGQTNKN